MRYNPSVSAIEVTLPITSPTGKIRVKRPQPGFAAKPVASRKKDHLEADDYLEWQISYDTDDRNSSTVVSNVIVKRKKVRYGCELVWLLDCCHQYGLLTPKDWDQLKVALAAQAQSGGIERRETVVMTKGTDDSIAASYGFHRHLQQTPLHLKTGADYAIEIKIWPKQRAVGTQAMIFVRLPLARCTSPKGPLQGRNSAKHECATFQITSANASLVRDTALAFVLASNSHARDIHTILSALGV